MGSRYQGMVVETFSGLMSHRGTQIPNLNQTMTEQAQNVLSAPWALEEKTFQNI